MLLLAAALVVVVAALGTFWAPGMALLSDSSERAGLDQAVAFSIGNLAWSLGHVLGGGAGGALADATSDALVYGLLGAGCALTLAGVMALGRGTPARSPARALGAVGPGRGPARRYSLSASRSCSASEASTGSPSPPMFCQVARLNWYLPRYWPARRDRARVAAGLALGDQPEDPRQPYAAGLALDGAARERLEAESVAGLRADHAVDRQALALLEALDRLLGLSAEHAVGGNTERRLDLADGRAAVAALDHHGRARALGRRLAIARGLFVARVGAAAPPPSADAPAGAHSSTSATNTPASSGRRTASTVACNVFVPLSDAYGVS